MLLHAPSYSTNNNHHKHHVSSPIPLLGSPEDSAFRSGRAHDLQEFPVASSQTSSPHPYYLPTAGFSSLHQLGKGPVVYGYNDHEKRTIYPQHSPATLLPPGASSNVLSRNVSWLRDVAATSASSVSPPAFHHNISHERWDNNKLKTNGVINSGTYLSPALQPKQQPPSLSPNKNALTPATAALQPQPTSVVPVAPSSALTRRILLILNKFTPENFPKLTLDLLNVGLDSPVILRSLASLIFRKATDEPKFTSLYAQLCVRLCEDAPNFETNPNSPSTFRVALLDLCQQEFTSRFKFYVDHHNTTLCYLVEASKKFSQSASGASSHQWNGHSDSFHRQHSTEGASHSGLSSSLALDATDRAELAAVRARGCIRFLCELAHVELVGVAQVHRYIQELLSKKKDVFVSHTQAMLAVSKAALAPPLHPSDSAAGGDAPIAASDGSAAALPGSSSSEVYHVVSAENQLVWDVEAACQLLIHLGARLDDGQARKWVEQYICRLRQLRQRKVKANSDVKSGLGDDFVLPSRVRFMIEDVETLREQQNWVARHRGQKPNSHTGAGVLDGGMPRTRKEMRAHWEQERLVADFFDQKRQQTRQQQQHSTSENHFNGHHGNVSAPHRERGMEGSGHTRGTTATSSATQQPRSAVTHNTVPGSAIGGGGRDVVPGQTDNVRDSGWDELVHLGQYLSSTGGDSRSNLDLFSMLHHKESSGNSRARNSGANSTAHRVDPDDVHGQSATYSNLPPRMQKQRANGVASKSNNGGHSTPEQHDPWAAFGYGRSRQLQQQQQQQQQRNNSGTYATQQKKSVQFISPEELSFVPDYIKAQQKDVLCLQGSNGQHSEVMQTPSRASSDEVPPPSALFASGIAPTQRHNAFTNNTPNGRRGGGGGGGGGSGGCNRGNVNQAGKQFAVAPHLFVSPHTGSNAVSGVNVTLVGTKPNANIPHTTFAAIRQPANVTPTTPAAPPEMSFEPEYLRKLAISGGICPQQRAPGNGSPVNGNEKQMAEWNEMANVLLQHTQQNDPHSAVLRFEKEAHCSKFNPAFFSFIIAKFMEYCNVEESQQHARLAYCADMVLECRLLDVLSKETLLASWNHFLSRRLNELETSGQHHLLKSRLARFLALLLIRMPPSTSGTVQTSNPPASSSSSSSSSSLSLSLEEVARPMRGGEYFPLFLLLLQQLHKLTETANTDSVDVSEAWLSKMFAHSGLQLRDMMPECYRSDEEMQQLLTDRNLLFLMPHLPLRQKLRTMLENGLNEECRPNLSNDLQTLWEEEEHVHTLPDRQLMFVHSLALIALDMLWTRVADVTMSDDQLRSEEEQFWRRTVPILQPFLVNSPVHQKQMLLALQEFWKHKGLPKDFFLRTFIQWHEQRLVETSVFLRWKRDFNPAYPAKGEALFEVNKWLNSLSSSSDSVASDPTTPAETIVDKKVNGDAL